MDYEIQLPSIGEYTEMTVGDKNAIGLLCNGELTEYTNLSIPVFNNSSAFRGQDDFRKLVIGANVGNMAFDGDRHIKEVILTGTSVGNWAFRGTTLERFIAPNLTSLSDSCLQNSTDLSFVYAPNVKHVGALALNACESLTDEGAESVFSNAVSFSGNVEFRGCISLENVYLPKLTDLAKYAANGTTFGNCYHLRRVYIPNLVTSTKSTASIPQSFFYRTASIWIFRVPLATSINEQPSDINCPNVKLFDSSVANIPAGWISRFVQFAKILILRKTDAVTSIANSTGMTQSFAVKVYVPSALKSSYESATNWSTLLANGKVEFYDLEGSRFEDPDYDDTDIYNADRGDL